MAPMRPAEATDDRARRRAAGVLLAATLAHNLEEGLAYAASRPAAAALIHAAAPGLNPPAPDTFRAVLAALSAALIALLGWAAITPRRRAAWRVLRAVAAVFLANVAIPHVPAAILLGGYAPGVVTAVAVNLPLCAWIVWRSGRALDAPA